MGLKGRLEVDVLACFLDRIYGGKMTNREILTLAS